MKYDPLKSDPDSILGLMAELKRLDDAYREADEFDRTRSCSQNYCNCDPRKPHDPDCEDNLDILRKAGLNMGQP